MTDVLIKGGNVETDPQEGETNHMNIKRVTYMSGKEPGTEAPFTASEGSHLSNTSIS